MQPWHNAVGPISNQTRHLIPKGFTLDLSGKNIILGAPGAFTPPCSSQVPQYIKDYDKYKAKGIKDIYDIAVNDAFVTKAWKEKLAPQGTGVRFIADDKGELMSSLGLIFDASGLLGSPRSKVCVTYPEACADVPPSCLLA
ncbi:Redoxin-domain-containing protein [Boletus edulis BED1]|uniref:Redoxin-domain-containing protein n=1 Tax=Boletus edulis BED1 TaxID=1328754 RepID=A0AAD4C8W2_BOLED|nr:Redoxin-domain-containing protein [Boletus edulis BED1]